LKQTDLGPPTSTPGPLGLRAAIRTGIAGSLTIGLFFLAACHKTSGTGVIATVGDQKISREELVRTIAEMKLPDKVPASVPSDVLNRLIDRALINQEAEREGLATEPAISRKIRNSRERILRQALIQQKVDAQVHVTDADVRTYFDQHKNEIKQPGFVVVRQLILPDLKTAQGVARSLKKTHGFARAIQHYKGGPVGKIFEGTVPPQFSKYFFNTPKGQVTGPLALKDGVHYFKIDRVEPGKLLSFDEAKSGISQFLTSQQKQERYQAFLNSLRAKTKISIDQKGLGEVMGASTTASSGATPGTK